MPSLNAVFLFLAVVGGAIALLQAIGSLAGMGSSDVPGDHALEHLHPGDAEASSALGIFSFRSVRAITAGISFTGIGGLLAQRQFGSLVSLALALALGTAMYLFVAYVMRSFSRLEADHTVHPLRAVGLEAMVSIPIPARGNGPGKVTLVVANRRVEWPAVQSEAALLDGPIPSGTLVEIVDADDDTTLTVVPHSVRP